MPGVGFILIPFDGSREAQLSASEAKSQKVIDDPVRETRLSELLEQRGMGDVKFMFTDRGVLIKGTDSQAMAVGRLVEDLPSLTPTAGMQKDNVRDLAAYRAKESGLHIADKFGSAARRFQVAPIKGEFKMAAHDEASTIRGRRPAINGSYGVRALAA